MISTSNGTMIPIIYKGGLPYIQHYYPTDKQMREITREEIMTSPGEWNPSLLDDEPDTSQKRLRQFPPTPIDQTDMFYNMEGDIVVQRSDINIDVEDDLSVTSEPSSTSCGSRRRTYRSRTRKEKQKKPHGPKGNIKAITWWDDPVPDPAQVFDSRVRGVPPDID